MTCVYPNCNKPKHAKKLCSAHYSAAIRSNEIAPKFTQVNKRTGYQIMSKNISKTREYNSWISMIHRCYDVNNIAYKYYGGAGVKVCKRWRTSFLNFLADMGPRPANTTIDRIDGYDDYYPKNCRWADGSTQAANKNSQYKIDLLELELKRELWV